MTRRLPVLLVIALSLLAVASTSGSRAGGGTLRVEVFGKFTGDASFSPTRREDWGYLFDPDAESAAPLYELYRCCLLRTLLGYSGQTTAEGGATLRPDLAVTLPTVSDHARTWTVHLRRGLYYAPPFAQKQITTPDIVRAIERALTPRPAERARPIAAFATWFEVVVGVRAFERGKASSIAGLETPDAFTIVVHLTAPTGDFGARLAFPLTAPIPPSPRDPSAPLGPRTVTTLGTGASSSRAGRTRSPAPSISTSAYRQRASDRCPVS
jgi:peptide/nickel transport system substrate-binding protein